MYEHTYCDRCREPLEGKSYELYLRSHDSLHGKNYQGDICENCYRLIAQVARLPLRPVRSWRNMTDWQDLFDPAFCDYSIGPYWRRLWKRK
jgi:hypothetical protein